MNVELFECNNWDKAPIGTKSSEMSLMFVAFIKIRSISQLFSPPKTVLRVRFHDLDHITLFLDYGIVTLKTSH